MRKYVVTLYVTLEAEDEFDADEFGEGIADHVLDYFAEFGVEDVNTDDAVVEDDDASI